MLAADELAIPAVTAADPPSTDTAIASAVTSSATVHRPGDVRCHLAEARRRGDLPVRLAVRRVEWLETGVRTSRAARRRQVAVGHHRERTRTPGGRDHPPAGGHRVRCLSRHRRRHRLGGVQLEDRASGDRLDDHRHPDDAVDRLVSAGHRPVPARRRGDPLRRHPRRGTGDRQRADHGDRPRPSTAACGPAG